MNPVFNKFISYYKPFWKVLAADLLFAAIASGVVLVYPMLVNVITKNAILPDGIEVNLIVRIAFVFLFLMIVEYFCNFFIAYWGHVMGAKMEFHMRNDLFQHFQKLSFSYYDNAKTGQLMSRITSDLFDVTELAHHGPEDIVISIIKIVGSFFILLNVNWILTLCIFAVLPFMIIFAVYYNKKMKRAFKKNRERIADINAQIEDSLSGVRVVKSFANEDLEIDKFHEGNSRFVESKKDSYLYMGRFHSGLSAFVSFINIVVVVVGALFINAGTFGLSELITFLLYINTLIEPVRKLINFTEQFQNGATGFERFMEILNIEPDIADAENAVSLSNVKGRVEFKSVGFRYEEGLEYVLKDIELNHHRLEGGGFRKRLEAA